MDCQKTFCVRSLCQEIKKASFTEEFRKQTDYISIVFIHTESAHAGALVLVSLHLPFSSLMRDSPGFPFRCLAGISRRGSATTSTVVTDCGGKMLFL